ncbi:hypothetical protein KGF54_003839 [Candida jiufengensis]|uniref:uncharacterized protein n=1 Tax=Candida jiufengensis TaxID=497108 RepID=UPI0022240248|nr:uncharacterized protein KGF54_003839 [Candida jiufengensis]KAI5950765.1 hypothetical protein KGF54_003839 [Candida jiufengensis]
MLSKRSIQFLPTLRNLTTRANTTRQFTSITNKSTGLGLKTSFKSQIRFVSEVVRINSIAPNFQAETTRGKIDLHEYIGDSWLILFSHPADFTPVCTTELGALSSRLGELEDLNAKAIALSVDTVSEHEEWSKDLEQLGSKLKFPIIDDSKGEIAYTYNMFPQEEYQNKTKKLVPTVRSLFIIDPNKKVRLILTYPPSVGRNVDEVIRALKALQVGDEYGVVTPVDWQPGQEVIIPPSISDEDATKKYGEFRKVLPYLRYTKVD